MIIIYKHEKGVKMKTLVDTVHVLPESVKAAIRYRCFDNLAGFYRRYVERSGISQATFYRAMGSTQVSEDTIRKLLRICQSIGIVSVSYEKGSMLNIEAKAVELRDTLAKLEDILEDLERTKSGEALLRLFRFKNTYFRRIMELV
jgi:hypothetical protein